MDRECAAPGSQPVWVAICSSREVRTQSSRVRDSTSSYFGFCELDRGGRTVRKRLGVCSPSTGGDCFGVALEQCAGAGVGAEGDGSGSDRERRPAAALLETRETSSRMMRAARGYSAARRVGGSSVVMIGVSGRGHRCRRRRRAHLHGVRVPGGMTIGTMGHMGAGHT
jgi:hypothetical protein